MYPPVPPEILEQARRVGRWVRWLLLAQLVWFVVFSAGGIDLVITLFRNGNADLSSCGAAVAHAGSTCVHHHSYRVPVGLLLIGFFGFVANGYLMAALGRRYLGKATRLFMGPRAAWSTTTVTFGAPIRDGDVPPSSPPSPR